MYSSPTHKTYDFNGFHFDSDALVLFFQGQIVHAAEKKSLAVLAAILANKDEVTGYDEIIERVWGEASYGISPARVNQYISRLQKLFAKYDPEAKFIENIRGRGYRFVGQLDVRILPTTLDEKAVPESTLQPLMSEGTQKTKRPRRLRWVAGAAGLLSISIVAYAAWRAGTGNDEAEVRRVVKESQLLESLSFYRHPAEVRKQDLDRFWLSDGDPNASYDWNRIENSIQKLIAEGRHYGDESKCERFDFQSVEIDAAGTSAVVKTLEKWFVAVHLSDGTLQKNKYIGPYFVSYVLRKADGRWLIEKSTTARVDRPIPRLLQVIAQTRPVAGHECLINIEGQDFEPATVFLEVTGPGCPASHPCKIPNSALLDRAQLSETLLGLVPITVASGEFTLIAHNGDSQPSNPLPLRVP